MLLCGEACGQVCVLLREAGVNKGEGQSGVRPRKEPQSCVAAALVCCRTLGTVRSVVQPAGLVPLAQNATYAVVVMFTV